MATLSPSRSFRKSTHARAPQRGSFARRRFPQRPALRVARMRRAARSYPDTSAVTVSPPLSSAPCCPRCQAMLTEDLGFRADMIARQLPQRCLRCMNGHRLYSGLPGAVA